jgi:hypothetical protein
VLLVQPLQLLLLYVKQHITTLGSAVPTITVIIIVRGAATALQPTLCATAVARQAFVAQQPPHLQQQ